MTSPIGPARVRTAPASPEPILELRNVDFCYRAPRRSAAEVLGGSRLRKINMSIRRGEAHGLIGESGSGKSTIAKLLLGLRAPQAGQILFDGELLTPDRLAAFRLRVQPVFQNPLDALNPVIPIGKQIVAPLLVNFRMRSSDCQARLAAAISAVGLSGEILGKLPHQISGGQAQRVNIARALILDPEVLICDEPVSALDMTVQAQILNLLSDLRESRGLSLLFISHDIRSVAYLCSEITVLKRGSIVESGSRDQVLLDPKTDYMKSLLRAVPNSELGGKMASSSTPCSQPTEPRHVSAQR
ncbi:ATP-binding cassette domain-containing protein [Bradyrhizobium sp. CB1650]|uniref:ABC transporter ATP-binding protein n=1 Tax=Bradyrhizobium sp. CB1650 TaxID=3039153 RepID=UPI00243548C4|nr:ATP-binding cassette domain-containing protein [Bradyrhizobium sp. CB1650]WGD51024.1 ATP-binding cassette domain-containing protein [Bradyrhizobium sp. CB1650]